MTERSRLPARRARMTTYEASAGGHLVTVTTGEHVDGALAEVFIDMHKEGSAFRSLMSCFAILVSLCLQHGVPLSLLVKSFAGVKFEPDGLVRGQPAVPRASSIVDYIFRLLAHEYPEQAGVRREAAE